MMSLLGGMVMLGLGAGAIALFRARGGEPHPLVKLPGMEATLALVIVGFLAAGIAMLVAWFMA